MLRQAQVETAAFKLSVWRGPEAPEIRNIELTTG
jgi:hypothetical protein